MTCPSCGACNEPAAEVCFSCRTVLAAVYRGTLLASRYEIQEFLGRGGMGTVYRAHDLVLHEDVAIKVLRTDLAQAPGMAERFLSEIRLARRVSHRNVCRIHEYGEEGGLRFISMELVEGRSFKEVLEGGPLPPAEAYGALEQAARGLVAIHEVGIVHRDLKPANLTLDRTGRVRVMDFGIAKAAGQEGDTTAGYLLGSPEYMSPEQARGRGADFRSDLYALGIVAFELFTGAPPFRGETPVATLLLHLEMPPPLDRPGSSLPAPLVPVLRRALAKDPRARQGSACELADEFQAAASGKAVGALLPSPHVTPPRSRLRGPLWAGGLLVVGAAMSALTPGSRVPQGAFSPTSVESPAPPESALSPTPSAPPSAATDPRLTVDRSLARDQAEPLRASPSGPIAKPLATGEAPGGPSPLASTPSPAAPQDDTAPPATTVEPSVLPSEPHTAPGFLLVVVSPWADVTLDGEPVGQTPLSRLSLPPGPHTVRLTHPAYQAYPRRVVVKSGETTRLVVDLTQDGVRARP